ncbi:MAG: gluconokinase [Chloroflexota bacterium]
MINTQREENGPGAVPPFVLAVDVGSSSVRALLYDSRGNALPDCDAVIDHVLPAYPDGGVEDDPDVLAEIVEQAVDAVLEAAGRRAGDIAAVGMDTFVGNLVGIGYDGSPTTPLYTYADARGAGHVRRMRGDLDTDAVYQRTGVKLHTAYSTARLAWLRDERPRQFQRTERWMDFATYLYSRWFGRRVPCSFSVASWSGLLDRRALEWDQPILGYLGIDRAHLPDLADYDSVISGLSDEHARRWPALKNTPFCLAVGDGAAANVGEGCVEPGDTAISVGTTGAVRTGMRGKLPRVPDGLSVFQVTRDLFLLGGAVTDAGSLYAWLHSTLRVPSGAELDEMVDSLPPDGHGLTVLPFLRGERSPGWAEDATGTISGIRSGTTAGEIIRASLEAVAYRFAVILQLLEGATPPAGDIVLGGGGALSSPAWTQIFAGVLDRPVIASGEPQSTSRGAALLALKAIGALDSVGGLPAERGPRYTPKPEERAAYRAGLQRHQKMYDTLLKSY